MCTNVNVDCVRIICSNTHATTGVYQGFTTSLTTQVIISTNTYSCKIKRILLYQMWKNASHYNKTWFHLLSNSTYPFLLSTTCRSIPQAHNVILPRTCLNRSCQVLESRLSYRWCCCKDKLHHTFCDILCKFFWCNLPLL